MNRRQWLTTTAGFGAALGGAGLFYWQNRGAPALSSSNLDTLWKLEFPSPEGVPIPMSRFQGRPLLINFWATWCPPCLKEMPLLSAFQRHQGPQGWQVLGLAVDNDSAVRAYLKQSPVDFAVGIAGMGGLDLASEWGNRSRQLPFSVMLDRSGKVIQNKLGAFTEQDLARLKA